MSGDIRRGAEIKFAVIAAASSGDNTVVAAVTGKRIHVLSYVIVAAAAVSVKWKSGASVDESGVMALAANGGVVVPAIAPGQGEWLVTDPGQALVLNLSGAISVGGHISYFEE